MLKLVLLIVRDVVVGFTLAGIALGIVIPILVKSGAVSYGGISGLLVITGVLVLAICGMLFRRGGALGRDREK